MINNNLFSSLDARDCSKINVTFRGACSPQLVDISIKIDGINPSKINVFQDSQFKKIQFYPSKFTKIDGWLMGKMKSIYRIRSYISFFKMNYCLIPKAILSATILSLK